MLDGTTFGNAWMHRTLIKILKYSNVRCVYVIMSILIIPITLLFSHGARITYNYYHKKRDLGYIKSLWNTYLNHVLFGQTVIDKFAMYAGHRFVIRYKGLEYFMKKSQQPESFLQLSAHIGCSEILGYSFANLKPSNVLAYGGEKTAVMCLRANAFLAKNTKMILVGTSSGHSDEIIKAIDNGEIIHAFADRFVRKNKVVSSKLHGHIVNLAKGPFSLAITRGLDVIMTCAMKESDGSYTAYLTPLIYDKKLSKRQQCQQLADKYVSEIEKMLDAYPLQWFNYSEIFQD